MGTVVLTERKIEIMRSRRDFDGQMYSWTRQDLRLRFWSQTKAWLLIAGNSALAVMVTKDQVKQIFKQLEQLDKVTIWMRN